MFKNIRIYTLRPVKVQTDKDTELTGVDDSEREQTKFN